jgi:hypothetical protein
VKKLVDMFELASRMKLRFAYKGVLSIEDLWDLTVQDLDKMYRSLNAKLKAENEDSLLGPKEKATTDLELQIGIIKHIVEVKLAEALVRESEIVRKEKKQMILEILSKKENSDLENRSVEDLQKMLSEL